MRSVPSAISRFLCANRTRYLHIAEAFYDEKNAQERRPAYLLVRERERLLF